MPNKPTASIWDYNGKTLVRIDNGRRSFNLGFDEAIELRAALGAAIDQHLDGNRPRRRVIETWDGRGAGD
jgi:hypothetical protein